ncbi:hypothetical protein GBAR_LOCUS18260, partial [Geodia barretti]
MIRPLTSLQLERPLHWTEISVELSASAITSPGASLAPVHT